MGEIYNNRFKNFLKVLEEDEQELHNIMVLHRGKCVFKYSIPPYRIEEPHILNSITKSFLSTAIGFAVEEGVLCLDDRVIDFFDGQFLSCWKPLKIRHLLTMTTGQLEDTLFIMTGSDPRPFFEVPPLGVIGETFLYNSGASQLLAIILQDKTGRTLQEYMSTRLFDPLGIDNVFWEQIQGGYNAGAYGLKLPLEAVSRFGELYRNHGVYKGNRVIDEKWVKEATGKRVNSKMDDRKDWSYGYGYQFWMGRDNTYRADGAFGQLCLICPDWELVICTNAYFTNTQLLIDKLWETLFSEEKASLKYNLNEREKLCVINKKIDESYYGVYLKTNDYEPNISSFRLSDSELVLNMEFYHGVVNKVYDGCFPIICKCEEWYINDIKGAGRVACMYKITGSTSLYFEIRYLGASYTIKGNIYFEKYLVLFEADWHCDILGQKRLKLQYKKANI